MSDWCILRMAGRSTLALATGLTEAGYEVWTPIEIERLRASRRRKAIVERPSPIMPTYVFARSIHIAQLFALASDPTRSLPGFSVFRYRDRIPLIADAELQALRRREERARIRILKSKKTDPFERGEIVKAPDGAFAGMSGVVELSDGKHTLVMFNGRFGVKIDTFLLRENEIGTNRPDLGTAA